jgi:hypothetical protein
MALFLVYVLSPCIVCVLEEDLPTARQPAGSFYSVYFRGGN